MSRRDMRPQLMQNALAAPDLGNAERVFLVTVVLLATEYVDGQRRPGSRGMDERGHFALHYDYLARALHTSADNAKKMTQRLTSKKWLSKVNPGTFGRPAAFQALDVRGDNTYRITFRSFVPPYAPDAPHIREDTTSPLTYRTPAEDDHAPTSGASRAAPIEVGAARKGPPAHPVAFHATACPWHEHWCPEDCANHPTSREASA